MSDATPSAVNDRVYHAIQARLDRARIDPRITNFLLAASACTEAAAIVQFTSKGTDKALIADARRALANVVRVYSLAVTDLPFSELLKECES